MITASSASLHKKLESFLEFFCCLLTAFLVVLLPTQLGFHFWPNYSLVNGFRIDYLSIKLYLTDALGLGIILLSAFTNLTRRKNLFIGMAEFVVLFFLGFFLIRGIFFNLSSMVSTARLLGFLGLGLALGKTIPRLGKSFFWLVGVMLFWPSLLGLLQFAHQGSIGSLAYFLGERTFNISTPGIAKGVFGGRLFLRPYASFSHPNSLAGFLLTGWLVLVYVYKKDFFFKKPNIVRKIFLWLVTFFVSFVVLISFSRLVWLTALMVFVFFLFVKNKKLVFFDLLGLVVVATGFLFPLILKLLADNFIHIESLYLRSRLWEEGWGFFKQSPFWGIGVGSFIPAMAGIRLGITRSWLQPIHNIYWLILVDNGIIGGLVLVILIFLSWQRSLKKNNPWLSLAFFSILITGFADHYWFTLQQNQLLVVLLMSLIWLYNKNIGKKGKERN